MGKGKNSNSGGKKKVDKKNDKNFYLHVGKQGKHISGHNNYIPGKSVITVSLGRLKELFNRFNPITIDQVPTVIDNINFYEIIGRSINPDTQIETPTTCGKIHYDATGGWHVVPRYPIQGEKR